MFSWHSARHPTCVGQCLLACSIRLLGPYFVGREERGSRKEGRTQERQGGWYILGDWRALAEGSKPWGCMAISPQTVTTREHSVPRQKVCSAPALAQPSSAQFPPPPSLATPQWAVGIWTRLSPASDTLQSWA